MQKTKEEIRDLLVSYINQDLAKAKKEWVRTTDGKKMAADTQVQRGHLKRTAIPRLYVRPDIYSELQGLIDDCRIMTKQQAMAKVDALNYYMLQQVCGSGEMIEFRDFGSRCIIYLK